MTTASVLQMLPFFRIDSVNTSELIFMKL